MDQPRRGAAPFTLVWMATNAAQGAGLAEDEARSLARDLASDGNEAEVRRIDGLGPGLRIRRGLACVDATITGLLASRERVEAELLAELDTLLAQHGGTPT